MHYVLHFSAIGCTINYMSEQHALGNIPTWTIGDRLGKALNHADISVGEMADYLGVHRNTLSGYLNGRRTAPRQTLMLWAMRTGVPLEWLETGVEPNDGPTPTPERAEGTGLSPHRVGADGATPAKVVTEGEPRILRFPVAA